MGGRGRGRVSSVYLIVVGSRDVVQQREKIWSIDVGHGSNLIVNCLRMPFRNWIISIIAIHQGGEAMNNGTK